MQGNRCKKPTFAKTAEINGCDESVGPLSVTESLSAPLFGIRNGPRTIFGFVFGFVPPAVLEPPPDVLLRPVLGFEPLELIRAVILVLAI